MSDGVGNNFEDTETSPKCQRCHMEPLAGKTVLHQWDDPETLFSTNDTALTHHFLPPEESGVGGDYGTEGPVAEGYLNNHAFMGANKADFGLGKIKSGFESDMEVTIEKDQKVLVETYLQNKTAHMFPGAHPMRRVLSRIVVTDANGIKLPFKKAKGVSEFYDVTNQLAVLTGNTIKPGFETVDVKYDKGSDVVIQGMSKDLMDEQVSSQFMDQTEVDWVSPDATVSNGTAVCTNTDDNGDCIGNSWAIKGITTVKTITDIDGAADHFTRIYGRETGKRAPDGTHVVRPGFDSNIAADNRLKPNERERYYITYDAKDVALPLTVKYKVYYLKKGASGKFPTAADGFLNTSLPAEKLKKLAIYEVFSKEEIIE
jgi:hypothetical protein